MKRFIAGLLFGIIVTSCATVLPWRDWKDLPFHPCAMFEHNDHIGKLCARRCKDTKWYNGECKEGVDNYEYRYINLCDEYEHLTALKSGLECRVRR